MLGRSQLAVALSLIDQVIVSGSRFAIAIMIGRWGSEAELGVYTLAFSLFVVFLTAQEALISIPHSIFFRQVGESQRRDYATNSLVQALLLAFVGTAVLVLAGWWLQRIESSASLAQTIMALGWMLVPTLLREFVRRFLFANLQVAGVVFLDLVASLAQIGILAWIGYQRPLDAATAYWVTGLTSGVVAVGALLLLRTEFRWAIASDWSHWLKKNLRFGVWVIAANGTSVLQMYTAHWMLVIFHDETAVGRFSAAMSAFLLANPFTIGISNLLSPKAAHRYVAAGPAGVRRLVSRYMGFVVAILTLYAVTMAFVGDWLITLLFGSEFSNLQTEITIIAFGTIAVGISYCSAAAMRAINRPDVNLKAGLVALGVTIAIAVVTASTMASLGAALAISVGFVTLAAILLVAFQKMLGPAETNDIRPTDPPRGE